jgi:ATP-dependent Lon protease
MPWHKTDDSIVDLRQSQKILAGSHCGLEKVKERIIEYLAVVQQAGIINSPVLCLLGAPGVGKTSLVKTIAMALGRKFVHLSLAGVDDSSYIKGHMRTYTGATPGMIVQLMQQADAKNPVILLDEIDKTGTRRGAKDVEYALLELLDPKLNEHFTDHCLQVPFDLSQVMFVTTANNIDDICPPLRDRLEVINIDSYTLTEKLKIAKTHLIPKIISSYKMDKGKIEFTDEAIQEIINFYTLEAGVRNLERSIETILRKILKSLLINSNRSAKVTTKNLPKYLGAPIFNNMIETRGYAGKVLGLSVGTYGGNILSIEAVKSQGVGKIQYTGNLGDILKESVETAYSCFRSQAPALGIKAKEYENHNIHVHLTSAATPKEGPSAGAAIYLAIISAVTQRKIRAALAVTGELGLTGQVMKVGGLKEKLIAAQRFKLDTVFIPEENLPDLNEIPKEVIQDLKIIEVNHISQILENAFETEA